MTRERLEACCPRHTVILSSYNRPTMVQRAISSVLKQTVQNFQLLITDDGSNEETVSSITKQIAGDPRCELHSTQHVDDSLPRPNCVSRAVHRINDAIQHISGEVVHYLADDDWYDTGRFEAFDALFSDAQVMVAYGRLVYVDRAGTPTGQTRYFDRIGDPCNVLDHNQVAHRREVFERVTKWPDACDFGPDGQFFRAMRRFWGFYGVDRVVAFKRMHSLNMQATTTSSTGTRE